MRETLGFLVAVLATISGYPQTLGSGSIEPVPFHEVVLDDGFWLPRIRLNHERTIPFAFRQSEETGRVRNFEVAGGLAEGTFTTIYPFDDSDVFKIIEGAGYSLRVFPDPRLDDYLDGLIRKIAAAQETDGYLYTNRTILGENAHEWAGKKRWELTHKLSHELYNLGHLFEAAVAHHQATGKKSLLEVALKAADLLVRDFGWGKLETYPGHQEVEIGLVKLYRLTGRKEYLDLARFFLDVRGPRGEAYSQSHAKVWDQSEAVGHAVRANYMYAAMADVAALTGEQKYLTALDRIWSDVVSRKIYLTGGVGARSSGESYGEAYELPNLTAYSETCASIANVMWNHRMFLLHGDGRYLDVAERSLYNAVLSGLGLSGDRFFYPNPLQSDGSHERSPWFGCACCPSNLTRFLPSVPGYIYAHGGNRLFVNLYVQSQAGITVGGDQVRVRQTTEYPWRGQVRIQVDPAKPREFELALRLPGWAAGDVFPGDLYRFHRKAQGETTVTVNGEAFAWKLDRGFAVISRKWKAGDEVALNLPMEARFIRAHPEVEADRGRVALQRGPLVYCLEWPDQPGGRVLDLSVDPEAGLSHRFESDLLNGIETVTGRGWALDASTNRGRPVEFKAIPYYAWAHRGKGEMAVWVPAGEK